MEDVRLGKLQVGGSYGISIGEESLFLLVDRASDWWKFKLEDLYRPPMLGTSWATLESPEKLLLSPKAKLIREGISRRCGEGWERALDRAVALIQESEAVWDPPEEEEEPAVPQEKPPLSREERELINGIFASPHPLEGIKPFLDDVAAGEDENKQHTFGLLTSGRSEDPREREMILFKSDAGAGKTTLIDALVKPYKTKVVQIHRACSGLRGPRRLRNSVPQGGRAHGRGEAGCQHPKVPLSRRPGLHGGAYSGEPPGRVHYCAEKDTAHDGGKLNHKG